MVLFLNLIIIIIYNIEENKEKLKLYILTQEEENLYETIINSMNNSINDLNKVNNMYKNLENEILQKLDIT